MTLIANTHGNGWVFAATFAPICILCSNGWSEVKKPEPPLSLYLDVDTDEIKVSDPLLIRVRLKNETGSAIRVHGGVGGFSFGDLGIEIREPDKPEWKSFSFSHIWIEPGVRVDNQVLVPDDYERIFLEVMAFRKDRIPTEPERPRVVRAFPEPGGYELRAVAKVSDQYDLLRSPPVKIRVGKRPDIEMIAIDIGEDLIREVMPIDIRRLPDEKIRQGDRLRKYLEGSALEWQLSWKSEWGEWTTNDDLIRGPAALKRLKARRDKEKGIRRDILTLALFYGYLNKEELDASKSELKLLPPGLTGRHVLENNVEQLEKKLRLESNIIKGEGGY